MTGNIRLTSKRQATFPKALCDQMGLKSGDSIQLEQKIVEGEKVWVLKPTKPATTPDRPWFGIAKKYAKRVNDHSMEAIRASIVKGRLEAARNGDPDA